MEGKWGANCWVFLDGERVGKKSWRRTRKKNMSIPYESPRREIEKGKRDVNEGFDWLWCLGSQNKK